jgi:hypothetical protein
MAGGLARSVRRALPFWQVIFWTTRRADAFDQHCRTS